MLLQPKANCIQSDLSDFRLSEGDIHHCPSYLRTKLSLRGPLDLRCEPFISTECSEVTLGDRTVIVFLEYI